MKEEISKVENVKANANPEPSPGGSKSPPDSTEQPTEKCQCDSWDPGNDGIPTAESIRKVLDALQDLVRTYQDSPTDASKQLEKDIQDCDKEYKAIDDCVKKYKDFHGQIDCKLSEAKSQLDDIVEWCSPVDTAIREAIKALWDEYDEKGKTLECDWIAANDAMNANGDCLAQAEFTTSQEREDFDTVKGFEKTVTERLADAKSLHGTAKTLKDAENLKGVCAVKNEFKAVYDNLSDLLLWADRRDRCCQTGTASAGSSTGKASAEPPDWKDLDATWYRQRLLETLRALILAKYQRFCWHRHALSIQKAASNAQTLATEFGSTRREKYIQEASDVQPKDDE